MSDNNSNLFTATKGYAHPNPQKGIRATFGWKVVKFPRQRNIDGDF